MAALSLDHAGVHSLCSPVLLQYNPSLTLLSLVLPILCSRLAIHVIQKDIFYGPSRGVKLRELMESKHRAVSLQQSRSSDYKRILSRAALFAQLQHLLLGAFLLACGVVGMHFGGK